MQIEPFDIKKYRQKIKSKQENITPESDEDEAAGEYYGELQSILDVIDRGASCEDIKKTANWVGELCP